MSDIFTPEKRSEVMSRIRSRGNRATELRLAVLMRREKIRGWRRSARLVGKPDFVFRHNRVAVFVDGCFWHCCPRCSNMPKSNARFWKEKLAGNQRRDRAVNRELNCMGWRVVRIWEHDLEEAPSRILRRLRSALAAQRLEAEGARYRK
jgi:DNA mismatch endonuclease, patch repair protein